MIIPWNSLIFFPSYWRGSDCRRIRVFRESTYWPAIWPPLSRRLLFFHSDNPSTRTDGVLWMGRWKYIHDRLHEEESLFDVESDPGEADELSARYPGLLRSLRDITQMWRRRQLAYYRFPMYYEHYLPPSPPTLNSGL